MLRATRMLAFFMSRCGTRHLLLPSNEALRRSHGWKSDLCRQNKLQGYTNLDSFANLSAKRGCSGKVFVAASGR